jgi:hypothetical protein
MKRKTNLFEQIKQFHVQDGPDLNWFIDECDMENFKEMCPDLFEDGQNPVVGERVLNGKEWNEWAIGSVWGDFEGHVVDEDCPKCGHLLVAPNEAVDEFKGRKPRYCSECEFVNEDLLEIEKEEEKEREALRNEPPKPKFRVAGQTLQEFCAHYEIDFEKKQFSECYRCKAAMVASDFYRVSHYAVISYSHKEESSCVNQPFMFKPLGEKQKELQENLGILSDYLKGQRE